MKILLYFYWDQFLDPDDDIDSNKGPSIKDVRTKSQKIDPPPPLSAKCSHWLNPLPQSAFFHAYTP